MDYRKIGERIRKYRKIRGLSQEMLAEKINISVTHMSHIETGNTKLSLVVFVDIVNALEISADDLLLDKFENSEKTYDKINSVLNECTVSQVKIISEIVKSTKLALDTYGNFIGKL